MIYDTRDKRRENYVDIALFAHRRALDEDFGAERKTNAAL